MSNLTEETIAQILSQIGTALNTYRDTEILDKMTIQIRNLKTEVDVEINAGGWSDREA